MNHNFDAVLLASGGLDSTTLAYWLLNKRISFLPLLINYGQHCFATERARLHEVMPKEARELIHEIGIGDIYAGSNSLLIKEPDLWVDYVRAEDFYLPYRNLLLLSVGAAFAQVRKIPNVYAAFINSNHAKEIDCSAFFFQRLGEMLSDYGSVTVHMPFREMTKADVARLGLELEAPIVQTFSCQANASVPCGACPNCVDRLTALKLLESV